MDANAFGCVRPTYFPFAITGTFSLRSRETAFLTAIGPRQAEMEVVAPEAACMDDSLPQEVPNTTGKPNRDVLFALYDVVPVFKQNADAFDDIQADRILEVQRVEFPVCANLSFNAATWQILSTVSAAEFSSIASAPGSTGSMLVSSSVSVHCTPRP